MIKLNLKWKLNDEDKIRVFNILFVMSYEVCVFCYIDILLDFDLNFGGKYFFIDYLYNFWVERILKRKILMLNNLVFMFFYIIICSKFYCLMILEFLSFAFFFVCFVIFAMCLISMILTIVFYKLWIMKMVTFFFLFIIMAIGKFFVYIVIFVKVSVYF